MDSFAVAADEVDVVVVGNPPGSELHRFSSAQFIQSAWAGVDRLVRDSPPVPIARMVAPELTAAMSEFVLTATLMLHRQVPEYRRSQTRRQWRPLPQMATGERRVAVLGYGAIGRPVASRLTAAGFDVMAWARSPREDPVRVVAGDEGWTEVLGRSHIVVNLLPLTAPTHGILDARAFALMPAGSALVNVARGGHVVEDDLLAALDGGRLSDAVLDVTAVEPLLASHPFWAHPHVTLFPHVAATSEPSVLAARVAANIARFAGGKTPDFLVEH